MIYYASFTPGMQSVVEHIVRERLADVVIQKLLDGAIIFETECSYDKLNFFCFNNIFAVISIVEKANPDTAIETHMNIACRAGTAPVIAENNKKIRTFRIITSQENKLVAVDEGVKKNTERYIAKQAGFTVDRSRPDTEFWFLYRNEGFSVFMKRLTKHGSFEKTLHPGELPPPLAYMMCYLSDPKPGDTVADPFCGYGSIPEQRLKRFPPAHFYASDIDEKALAYSRNKITGTLLERCHFKKADLYGVPALLPPGGIDAIITDPPWGMYDKQAFELGTSSVRTSSVPPNLTTDHTDHTDKEKNNGDAIGRFYADMVGIFAKVLKPGGRAVILTAKKDELTAGVEQSAAFDITETLPILVSGKKASVFVLRKR
ncbi:hypothetical protein FACS1894124_1470 [Spirochaetia bacterium]|nr:hypothetical protein FACS1894124_1470 [Spirochaetia bacterium]